MRIFNLLSITILASACSHTPHNTKLTTQWTPLSANQQRRIVRKQTKQNKEYSGLHLSFSADLIFLNSKIQNNNLKIKSQFKNWTPEVALEKRNKQNQHLSNHSEFFLTFYSPQTKRNKLDQASSGWKAILKINDIEHQGVIKPQKNISHHNKIYYPDLNPWSTPYLIIFPIATQKINFESFEVVIMGPEGMARFKY